MSSIEQRGPTQVEFHYIKSGLFRVVHVDGAWGGATPRGHITMSVFSERGPIPQRLVHQINDDGTLGEQVSLVSKTGIIREVEVELVIDLEAARSISDWLTKNIKTLTAAQETGARP